MTPDDLLTLLASLRQAQVAGRRAPHKPLFLLWLVGRFVERGSTAVSYVEAEEPVSRMINDFGPAVSDPGRARRRAAMPFVHLERELWELRDAAGTPLGPRVPDRSGWLHEQGAHGRLRAEVEALLAEPGMPARAARLLLDQHFTPALEPAICAAAGLDLTALEEAALRLVVEGDRPRRPPVRRAGFAEEVLRAYAYACAMCGFDGALGRDPVGLEAAHIRWHSQDGPDELPNALALCSLHHTLFDLGVLGLTARRRIRVSALYVARGRAGLAVADLEGEPLTVPRRADEAPARRFVEWHDTQVFKRGRALAGSAER
ncbi:restriction endonuclease [Streptomyces sp. 8K308]|uniref:phosphorothioated DNA-binding restriction endonuclease n=1 Tax=Streptomyces sp. 8K308 TaxID=2530388 RepID=UPI0010481428|nr:HNH endonuclease [Streptomyces sp. 8K308]TDC22582.1 restriction endonuclease [Streptomyces sp. 8K308]